MTVLARPTMTLADFLVWENEQPQRHEFHHGERFAMVGGRRAHGRVVVNLLSALHASLKGTACQVFGETMKLQIGEDTMLYPDVFVTCDKADLGAEQIFRSPTLMVEVLSPSTQGVDRRRRFALYRRIPALQEYVLVDPDTRRIEAFRRGANDRWVLHDMSEGEALVLASVEVSITLDDVFDGTRPSA